ncbi:MAG: hypothetical protein PHP56_12795 [Smithellaceae bacterium]|nr:hypothetical protein [Smithellaceae bacterium]
MTSSELITLLTAEIKGLSVDVVSADYTNAVSEAQLETGWTLPVTDNFQVLWIKRRAKRHLIYMLCTESARKFKVDQISLGDRFKHYVEIIKMEDRAFKEAMEDRPDLFCGISAQAYFGQQVGTCHAYDELGREITDYSDVFNGLQSDSGE